MVRPRFVLSMLFACAAVGILAPAQSSQDPLDALRNALVGKRFVQRGFSGDNQVHWRWEQGHLVEQQPTARMLALLKIDSVKLNGSRVELGGLARALVKDKAGNLHTLPYTDPVHLFVDLSGAELDATLRQLPGLLFYPDSESALHDLPQSVARAVPPAIDSLQGPPMHPTRPTTSCDCADEGKPACATSDGSKPRLLGIAPPHLTFSVPPDFTDAARAEHFSGSVQVGFKINVDGSTADLWIVHPSGFGLNQAAAQAVARYRFQPATCHGNPVATDLFVDVNFSIGGPLP